MFVHNRDELNTAIKNAHAGDEIMYYVWMDFFLDKKGEEWLKTHKTNDDK